MTNLARAFETGVVESYRTTIEEHIKESHYTDALEKLIDFVRDCSPNDRADAIGLYARYTRWKAAERRGVGHTENINEIVQAILEMTELVASRGHIGGDVALDAVDLDVSNSGSMNIAGTLEPGVKPQTSTGATPTGKIVTLVRPETQESKARAGAANPFQQGGRSDAHAPLAESLSEEQLRTELSRKKLDQVRQAYLEVWRDTRSRRDDTLLVQARDLTKNFPKSRFSLGPVSFDLIAGEITGVIGMNASGKTTLLRLLMGEIAPSAGMISYPKLSGGNSNWLSVRNEIAYVSQMPERWHGRLRLNLNYTAAAYGSLGKANDELVDWYVHRYGLKEYEAATWDRISGGFKIRFELVRALLTKPKILVLDEPLAYLDIVTQQIFLSDIRSISSALDNPIPIIITSQHLYEIEAIANKMIILDDGHCLYSGPILQMPHLQEFRTYEITVHCEKKDLLDLLNPFGLLDIEVTMTSYLLTFSRDADHIGIPVALLTQFGDRLIYFRDITHSTRSLFRNKRDEIVREEPEH